MGLESEGRGILNKWEGQVKPTQQQSASRIVVSARAVQSEVREFDMLPKVGYHLDEPLLAT